MKIITFERELPVFDKRLCWLLVRVCTVAKRHPLHISSKLIGIQVRRCVLLAEVIGDSVIVRRSHLECLERQCVLQSSRDRSIASLPCSKELGVILWI